MFPKGNYSTLFVYTNSTLSLSPKISFPHIKLRFATMNCFSTQFQERIRQAQSEATRRLQLELKQSIDLLYDLVLAEVLASHKQTTTSTQITSSAIIASILAGFGSTLPRRTKKRLSKSLSICDGNQASSRQVECDGARKCHFNFKQFNLISFSPNSTPNSKSSSQQTEPSSCVSKFCICDDNHPYELIDSSDSESDFIDNRVVSCKVDVISVSNKRLLDKPTMAKIAKKKQKLESRNCNQTTKRDSNQTDHPRDVSEKWPIRTLHKYSTFMELTNFDLDSSSRTSSRSFPAWKSIDDHLQFVVQKMKIDFSKAKSRKISQNDHH